MTDYLYLPLLCWGIVAAIMLLVYLWALKIKNNGIVDIFWAFNFLVIAAVLFTKANGFPDRILLVCGLAALWSLRLGVYLLIRVGSHLSVEEGRYKQLRQEWNNTKFFFFYQMQAFSNVMLAIPFFIIAVNPAPALTFNEYLGAGMWLICIVGEGLSDWQLQNFKSKPENKGKVCQDGLWNYSRHPNYFFQFSIWVSVSVFAISSPYGWLSLICPISIGYLIFKVTGIPMTEEQAVRSKGDAYKEYQRTTSVFVPWFKTK